MRARKGGTDAYEPINTKEGLRMRGAQRGVAANSH